MNIPVPPDDPGRGYAPPGLLQLARHGQPADSRQRLSRYEADQAAEHEQREREYATITNSYYDLVTDFFEYGWGESFHFAPRARGETRRQATVRHEHWLALRLGLSPEHEVLDVGCGVGGPMREIVRFAGCRIIGLNNNAYQVERAELLNRRAGLDGACRVLEGDFMAPPLPEESLDAAYAIEATVHAPRLADVYSSVRRVLKPGGLFASYEWCLTPHYDDADPAHRRLKRNIEVGNGLVNISTTEQAIQAVAEAGLELLDVDDRGATGDIPWWEPLAPTRNRLVLRRTSGLGRTATNASVRVLETLRIAPRGTTRVARLLEHCGRTLMEAGREGVFSPSLFILARKGRD